MDKPIKLSIAATSKRVDIANVVGYTFFNSIELPRQSQLDIAMGWRDSELGGTGPAILVGNKKHTFGFGNPVGLSAMAYLGCGFLQEKNSPARHRRLSDLGPLDLCRAPRHRHPISRRHQETEISAAHLDAPARQAGNDDLCHRRSS